MCIFVMALLLLMTVGIFLSLTRDPHFASY